VDDFELHCEQILGIQVDLMQRWNRTYTSTIAWKLICSEKSRFKGENRPIVGTAGVSSIGQAPKKQDCKVPTDRFRGFCLGTHSDHLYGYETQNQRTEPSISSTPEIIAFSNRCSMKRLHERLLLKVTYQMNWVGGGYFTCSLVTRVNKFLLNFFREQIV
jgi:hypothetical protein